MKTAVDTSVLLDVLGADPEHGERSRTVLSSAYRAGALVVCDVVWAEVRAHFAHEAEFREVIGVLGVRFEGTSVDAATLAGKLWRDHRKKSRAARPRVMADFLIGAHAKVQADALLTRDRSFYREYFTGLRVIDPTRAQDGPLR